MPLEINYDESGKPKTVVLAYDEYQFLLAKTDERVILQQTASRIIGLIHQFVRDEEMQFAEDEPDVEESSPEDEFAVPEDNGPPEEKPAPVDVRRYKDATGYYDSGRFRVLKGSKASGSPSDTFNRLNAAVKLRDSLIEFGILVREGDWGDFTFTRDYRFRSPSAAACIVDGNSRSGPEAWGRRRY
ncbi:MAG: DUF4357 domain-containing protein [Candidatus Nealsonbacteria bacterium]|nr:DUF4357 domain-containing protein [Candidatus Nealsonbacteria bacterium]